MIAIVEEVAEIDVHSDIIIETSDAAGSLVSLTLILFLDHRLLVKPHIIESRLCIECSLFSEPGQGAAAGAEAAPTSAPATGERPSATISIETNHGTPVDGANTAATGTHTTNAAVAT